MSASDTAKSRMDRILRLHDMIDEIKADIREVYAEEKADGGDKTAMGAAVTYIRKREKDGAALADREAMVDVYVAAYDASHTHAREATQSKAEKTGLEVASAANAFDAIAANHSNSSGASSHQTDMAGVLSSSQAAPATPFERPA